MPIRSGVLHHGQLLLKAKERKVSQRGTHVGINCVTGLEFSSGCKSAEVVSTGTSVMSGTSFVVLSQVLISVSSVKQNAYLSIG